LRKYHRQARAHPDYK